MQRFDVSLSWGYAETHTITKGPQSRWTSGLQEGTDEERPTVWWLGRCLKIRDNIQYEARRGQRGAGNGTGGALDPAYTRGSNSNRSAAGRSSLGNRGEVLER